MKTIEELNALKADVEEMNRKLSELSDDELSLVTGGTIDDVRRRLEEFINVGITITPDETHGPISR
ncbi:MAG: bacteriocin [Eubacteriales bacterium]|nr:bacteriocin [Eubacteriales bacterium]